MEDRKSIALKICIVGVSGSGKSTLVNTLRGLQPNDPDAADTGVVKTTATPKQFVHPQHPNVTFCVMPGYDSSGVPSRSFLRQIDLESYQLYFIVCSYRFMEDDLWFALELKRAAKRFFFIRTKIDIDVRHDQEDYPEKHTVEAVLLKIKQNCVKELSKGGITDHSLFLVGKDRHMYDFPKLEKNLIPDPDISQGDPIVAVDQESSKIDELTSDQMNLVKTQQLEDRLQKDTCRCIILGSERVPNSSIYVNCAKLCEVLTEYKTVYLLDDDNLARHSEASEMHIDELINMIRHNFWYKFSSESLMTELEKYGKLSGRAASSNWLKFPRIGYMVLLRQSYKTTKHFLRCTITSMNDASKSLLNAVYSKIERCNNEKSKCQ